MSDELESATWRETLVGMSAAATDFAKEIVRAHTSEDGTLGDSLVELPQPVKNAFAYLAAIRALANARSENNIDDAVYAAYQAGLLTSAVWKDEAGRSLTDVLDEFENTKSGQSSGGSKSRLTDSERAQANVLFLKFKDGGSTDNGAVMAVLKEVNKMRNSNPVSKSTIERAVGIRHKSL